MREVFPVQIDRDESSVLMSEMEMILERSSSEEDIPLLKNSANARLQILSSAFFCDAVSCQNRAVEVSIVDMKNFTNNLYYVLRVHAFIGQPLIMPIMETILTGWIFAVSQ